ncbi:hypothetical protein ACFL59_14170 [Planctomycetota bacterium]
MTLLAISKLTVTVLVVVLVLAALGAVGLLLLMVKVLRSSARREADEAIAPLRNRVTSLLETAERLKARYERLTGKEDPSVPAPTGRTLELASAADHEIQSVWTEWTVLQAMLEKVRDRERNATDVAGAGLREAAELVGEEEDDADQRQQRADAHAERAKKLLGDLEDAPLRAVGVLDAATAGIAKIRDQLTKTAADVPVDLEELDREAENLGQKPWSDPLGTAERAETLLERIGQHGAAIGVDVGAPPVAAATGFPPTHSPPEPRQTSAQPQSE